MISDKPWSPEGVARLMLAIIITSCLGMLLGGLIEKLNLGLSRNQLSGDQLDALGTVIGGVFLQGTALGWIALFLHRHNISWTDAFGFRQSKAGKIVAWGFATGAVFVPIAWGLQALSIFALEHAGFKPETQLPVAELQNPAISLAIKIALGIIAVVLAPVAEESLFRGIIYPAIKQRGHRALAWWGTSALFALMHLNAPSFLPLLVFALTLTALYEAFGNLLVPIVAHCVFNGSELLTLIFQKQLERLHW